MQIDWITVAAQIVNFLILVWLLQRFLYAPVIGAMERREAHIAERLEEADERLEAADRKAEAYEQKDRELEGRRQELLQQARKDAESYRERMLAEAREEVDEERRQVQVQIRRERREVLHDLRRRVAEQIQALARRVLGDLADRGLEEQIAAVFAQRVTALEEYERREITESALAQDGRLTVRSSTDLPADARRRLTRALHEVFGDELDVAYGKSTDLTWGIELRAGGRSVLWSLDSYLEDFEDRMSKRLEEMAASLQPEAAA